jgi:hypothetical protein
MIFFSTSQIPLAAQLSAFASLAFPEPFASIIVDQGIVDCEATGFDQEVNCDTGFGPTCI